MNESPTETKEKKPRAVRWYRTPLESSQVKELHARSDLLGLLQSVTYLGLLVLTGASAIYSAYHFPLWSTIALVFLHGTVSSFLVNAMHEVGHGTVFKTKSLTTFFVRIFSFLGWNNYELFHTSHARHHRYTLHHPDDLEVVLPWRLTLRHFFLFGFINFTNLFNAFKGMFRIAAGRFRGEWELTLFPEGDTARRRPPARWARTVLIGHGLVLLVSIYFQLWMLPLIITLAPFYGGWIFFLCNNTQHIGLQDNVPDFRLCCRTFTLNPVLQFLYWHMNYHIEHHMYAGVPCYRLGKLHRLIKHDLPPCPHGLIETWKQIAEIQRRQDGDPSYQYAPPLPVRSS